MHKHFGSVLENITLNSEMQLRLAVRCLLLRGINLLFNFHKFYFHINIEHFLFVFTSLIVRAKQDVILGFFQISYII